MKKRIDVITLGCSKNLVDSERLLKRLRDCGFNVCHDSDNVKGDIVVVNTCGFIGDAKEESVNTILEYADAKNRGTIKQLYVMGCLSERYRDELKDEIPEIDLVIVDLYPFEATVASGASEQDIIEKIDIGGISLIRAAAKNFNDVVIVASKEQYPTLQNILNERGAVTTRDERKALAREAFGVSSHYDTAIHAYFAENTK